MGRFTYLVIQVQELQGEKELVRELITHFRVGVVQLLWGKEETNLEVCM